MEAEFRTPGGHTAVMEYRDGTSDWNTIAACLMNPLAPTGNEYDIPSGLSGWALDVGAHIGSVTVGLLLDNPDLRVVAIEGVPENAELIVRNVERNKVDDRAIVYNYAAWSGKGGVNIEYGYTGNETATTHRYIGSVDAWMDLPAGGTKQTVEVSIITLREAIEVTDGQGFVWAKTDCEGCEHRFFRGAGLRKVGTIVGEWHRRSGTPEGLERQLSKTHTVTWTVGDHFGGPFKAVPK